jgi:hypothetical protein
MKLKVLFLLLLVLSLPSVSAHSEDSKDYQIALYGAVMMDSALAETAAFTAKMDSDFKFATLAAGKKIGSLFDKIDFELEGQVVKHLEGQHYWEFNALVIARWLRFPWGDIIKTSFAVGEGLSYGTETSPYEEKYHGEQTSKFLNYLMFEFDFALPHEPRWSLVARLHHRSGVFGLFDGVYGATNAYCLGIRYHF